MKIEIDTDEAIVRVTGPAATQEHPLESAEAFDAVSDAWLRAGWDAKHVYSFAWLGRPIIQLPEDMVRAQEVIYTVKPDVIIETGIAHGGSLVFYATLCRAMGRGRVIGVDVEIRPHNREALEQHELFDLITLFEGSSTDESVLEQLRAVVGPSETALVLLDSNHTREHVRAELEAYAPFVSVGSYLVAADGIMEFVVGAPRTRPEWTHDNPRQAVRDFLRDHEEFVLEQPPFPFNEGLVTRPVTYWPDGWLRRVH